MLSKIRAGAQGRFRLSKGISGGIFLLIVSAGFANAQEKMFRIGEGVISRLAISPSSELIAIDANDFKAAQHLIILFDITKEKTVEVIRYERLGPTITGLGFSKDGKSLVAAGGMQSRVHGKTSLNYWDVTSGVNLKTLELEGQTVALTDRYFVTRDSNEKKLARVFDIDTGGKIAELKPLQSQIDHACVSPDGKYLAVAENDGPVHVFEAPSGKLSFTIDLQRNFFRSMMFSETEPVLAVTAAASGVRMYDLKTGKTKGGVDFFPAKVISPNGKMLAYKGEVYQPEGKRDKRLPDGLHILSREKQKIIATFNVDPRWRFRQIRFTPDNRSLIAVGDGGIVRIWDVSKLEP